MPQLTDSLDLFQRKLKTKCRMATDDLMIVKRELEKPNLHPDDKRFALLRLQNALSILASIAS